MTNVPSIVLSVNRGVMLSKAGHSSPQASSLQSEVTEVEKDLTLRCLLWESLQEWQGLVDQWEATPFETLKIDEVQQDVTRFIQTVFLLEKGTVLARVVRKVDIAIHRINHNPGNSVVCLFSFETRTSWIVCYLVIWIVSYPAFEQLESAGLCRVLNGWKRLKCLSHFPGHGRSGNTFVICRTFMRDFPCFYEILVN